MILGFILRALLTTAVIATAATIVVYIAGTITRPKLKETVQDNGIKDMMITKIDRCRNIVTVQDMDSDKKLEVHGDDVSYELSEGEQIRV